jgi:hypothetical protein
MNNDKFVQKYVHFRAAGRRSAAAKSCADFYPTAHLAASAAILLRLLAN